MFSVSEECLSQNDEQSILTFNGKVVTQNDHKNYLKKKNDFIFDRVILLHLLYIQLIRNEEKILQRYVGEKNERG